MDAAMEPDVGLVVVAAQDAEDIGVAQRVDEGIAIGDRIVAQMRRDDDGLILGDFRQRFAEIGEGVFRDRLGGVVEAFVVFGEQRDKEHAAFLERVA